jgi:hypothetical protein
MKIVRQEGTRKKNRAPGEDRTHDLQIALVRNTRIVFEELSTSIGDLMVENAFLLDDVWWI